MHANLEKNAGLALIVSSILMVLTMVLHPVGGDIDHILSISTLIIVTHSIALLSTPISLFGFWGLTRHLQQNYSIALLAFFIMLLGLVAVVIAAALNGLVLPMFLQGYANASSSQIEMVNTIRGYNHALNHAFDFIYIIATCLSIGLWSYAIIKTKSLPTWIAYFGMLLSLTGLVMFFAGVVFVDLQGFRLFIFGSVIWIVLVGIYLMKSE